MGLVRRSMPEKHHAAITPEELRELIGKLWMEDKVGSLAVVFGALTAGRANEYIKGKWDEIDLEEKTFSVPQERRKDKKRTPTWCRSRASYFAWSTGSIPVGTTFSRGVGDRPLTKGPRSMRLSTRAVVLT